MENDIKKTAPLNSRERVEKVAGHFNRDQLVQVREQSWSAIHEIKNRIRVGMRETQALRLADQILKELGAPISWHKPYIRFGHNTLRKYGEESIGDPQLKENDIYFIDIGPVWSGYEGDAGDTFTIGSDPEMARACDDARAIFAEVRDGWAQHRLSGAGLYLLAQDCAQKRGWEFFHRVDGHRISDFPHQAYFKGGLADAHFDPHPYAWVLEIQIRHPIRPFGAFYEDILF